MRTTKLLLTIVLITAFLAESTGAGCLHLSELTKQDSLRPAASAQNGLLLVKRFIGGENAAGGGISRTAEISILVNELLQCNSLIDGDALLSDKLLGIQKSLDAVISSKIDAISHTTKEEALRLKTDIEQLRERQTKDEQRLTQDEKGGTKKQKISLLKTVRTAAEVLSVVGILIFVASYFNNYCLLLAKLHPLLFCVLVAFITSLTGDYLRQRINIFRGLQDSIDKRHILRFGIVYSVISGFAIGYLWHNLSPINDRPDSDKMVKILIDQMIFAPFYFIPYLLASGRRLVEKEPFSNAVKYAMRKWSIMYAFNFALWPWALPLSYFALGKEIPFLPIAMFGLIWSVTISFIVSDTGGDGDGIAERNSKIYRGLRYLWIFGLIYANLTYPFLQPSLIIVSAMAVAWSFFFTYNLQKEPTSPAERIAPDIASDDAQRKYADMRTRFRVVQQHLADDILNYNQPSQQRIDLAGVASMTRDNGVQHIIHAMITSAA